MVLAYLQFDKGQYMPAWRMFLGVFGSQMDAEWQFQGEYAVHHDNEGRFVNEHGGVLTFIEIDSMRLMSGSLVYED